MKIRDGAANPYAVDFEPQEEERYVLVENCSEEELEWAARSRYSDAPGASKRVDYKWAVGDIKRIEENYTKVVFGAWDIKEDENYVRIWTMQMQKQASKWPSNAPPHMRIYAEKEDGTQGELLYDTRDAWMKWLEKFGRTELPRRTSSRHKGDPMPPMPRELEEMDKEQLMSFAEEIGFPLPDSWHANDMREVLFTYAPMHMLRSAIEETKEMFAAEAAKAKSKETDKRLPVETG